MRNPFSRLLAAAAVAAALAPAGGAHEVRPMIAKAPPVGPGTSYKVVVRNTDAYPITLEIEPFRVSIDDDGKATRTQEENDIILFPPQTIIQPGDEQAVQVRYAGPADVQEGRLYAILLSQVPVDFSKTTNPDGTATQIKIGFNFVSHLIVQPPSAKPILSVGEGRPTDDGRVAFDVANTGNGVAILRDAEWLIKSGDGAAVRLPADAVDFGAFGAILPGGRRSMSVAASHVGKMAAPISAEIILK